MDDHPIFVSFFYYLSILPRKELQINITDYVSTGYDLLIPGKNSPSIYLFKVSNGNTKTMCGIYSELTIKTLEQRP